jgi:hypothetical protein
MFAPRILRVSPTAIAGLLAGVACVHHQATTAGVKAATARGDVATPPSAYWVAVLAPPPSPPSNIQGRADITLDANRQNASVLLVLTGLSADHAYIWHIRRGPCSVNELSGPPSEYAPLTIDSHGRGTAAGTFPVTDPTLGDYHIGVHPADSSARPIAGPDAACGALMPRNY